MSNILFLLPWGIANLLAEVVFHDRGDLTFYILGLTLIEVGLIIFQIYPKVNLFRFNVNSVVFYLLVNISTNIIMFLWVFSDLGI